MVQTSAAPTSSMQSRYGLALVWISVVGFWLTVSHVAAAVPDAADYRPEVFQANSFTPSCLLVDTMPARGSGPLPSAGGRIPQRIGDCTLRQLADDLSDGMLRQICRRRFGYRDFPADLHVLVANRVDRDFSQSDAYWQYYLDCDRWDVQFSDRVCTVPEKDLIFDAWSTWSQAARRLWQHVEFAVVEHAHCVPQRPQELEIKRRPHRPFEAVVKTWMLSHSHLVPRWERLWIVGEPFFHRLQQWCTVIHQAHVSCCDAVNFSFSIDTDDED